jgi:pSer/pThr/pTyr-binding forkhead associated (FHA) protein
MAFLKVFAQGEERTVFLGDDPVLLGRAKECDILLNDLKASREHAVIEPYGEGEWRVRDLGSGNGTKVNGRKVERHVLEPEDVVQIGDAKVLFAAEAAAVVVPAAEGRPRRRAQAPRKTTPAGVVLAVLLLVAAAALLFAWKGVRGRDAADRDEVQAYRAVVETQGDEDLVQLADTFLKTYPDSGYAETVRAASAKARRRIETGAVRAEDGYDPTAGMRNLHLVEQVRRLQEMARKVPENRRAAVRAAHVEARKRLREVREREFAQLQQSVDDLVTRGEFAQARELWFFMHEDLLWQPIPPAFLDRIVTANVTLENAAAAARTRLFEEEARAESAHDFKRALELLKLAEPRFKGTSVSRSLAERRETVERAMRLGVKGKPTAPPTRVRVDVEKKARALLKGLAARRFDATAAGLRALADEAKKTKDRGFAEIDARARECEAAAGLHRAMAAALAAGQLPKRQIEKRWRVLSGDADRLSVRTRGKELTYDWVEVPTGLYLPLLQRHADQAPNGNLGLAVIAHALGAHPMLASALAQAYLEDEKRRPALDAFVAARVKAERVPEGGYVVHAGEILTRKRYLRLQEEEAIIKLQERFDALFLAIQNDKAFAKLKKLTEKKDKLDEARKHALALIFDEKKYFYPYRGTGREGEYQKVQQEVDRRVRAVRELWDATQTATVKKTPDVERALKQFDEVTGELEKRFVDVEEKRYEVEYLRSYLGQKFDIRTFYRSSAERDLLRYSVEVMEFNTKVEGDITPVEREQVKVTNGYRMMFGRWPVRLVKELVLSSRGHCEEMSRLGYFGHFSPTPGRRTPYDRMRLQGYKYGASENCVAGSTSPEGAHTRWCHSSGHHRNILMPPWTEMGTGHHGSMMTQNYGQAPKWSKHDPEPEDEPDDAWEDDDEEIIESDDGDKEDDGVDYGDDDEE